MQDIAEENQAKMLEVQRKGLHNGRIYVRVMAGFLCLQGISALISTIVSLISEPTLILSTDFLALNVSIFVFLLVWGLWTFKRWAYWITLLVEILALVRGIFIVILPPSSFRIGSWEGIAFVCVLFLIASPNVRQVFFRVSKKSLPEKGSSGIGPRFFED